MSSVPASLRLGVCQPLAREAGEEGAKVDDAVGAIGEAGELGVELLCFPESYPGPIRAGSDYDAEGAVAAAARAAGCAVCWGRIEAGDDGRHRTVAYLHDRDGRRALRYERAHPATGDVHEILSGAPMAPGPGLGLGRLDGLAVGVLVCSELWLPEVARSLAVAGAEVLLAPAGGNLRRVAANWRLLAAARAVENECHLALTQALFGDESGSALIAGPESVLARSQRPGLLVADADLERARWLREHDDSMREPKPFAALPGLLRARRPQLYAALAEPGHGLYDYEVQPEQRRTT